MTAITSPVDKMKALAVAAGWKFEPALDLEKHQINENALLIGGYRYATLLTPDGAVTIALGLNSIYYHNNQVWVGGNENDGSYMVIAGVYTLPEFRGKGLATAALKLIMLWAKDSEIKLFLEPTPIKSLQGKGSKMNGTKLAKWYKKLGFVQLEKGRDSILQF